VNAFQREVALDIIRQLRKPRLSEKAKLQLLSFLETVIRASK
jgi:hypothetical protein